MAETMKLNASANFPPILVNQPPRPRLPIWQSFRFARKSRLRNESREREGEKESKDAASQILLVVILRKMQACEICVAIRDEIKLGRKVGR